MSAARLCRNAKHQITSDRILLWQTEIVNIYTAGCSLAVLWMCCLRWRLSTLITEVCVFHWEVLVVCLCICSWCELLAVCVLILLSAFLHSLTHSDRMLCAEPSHLGDETVNLTRRPVRCGFHQFWLAPLRISGKSGEESGGLSPWCHLSPPAIVWAPLNESIKCYFMPK